jgi:hypothetical protein
VSFSLAVDEATEGSLSLPVPSRRFRNDSLDAFFTSSRRPCPVPVSVKPGDCGCAGLKDEGGFTMDDASMDGR